MPEFLQRLMQRKLMQWCLAYLAGAWALLQVVDFVAEKLGWPGQVSRIALALLGVGFLIVVVLAWYHGEQGHQRVTVPEIVILSSLLLIGVAAVALVVPEPGGETRALAAVAESPPAIEERSLAVLPFANLSEEKSNEYFSDGITEEILNTVARLPGLRVASRTSSFSFKGQNVGLDQIAQRLRVAHVLEGSVQKSGASVRIWAKLIDTRSDRQVWSKDFDRDLKDVFAVQQEIALAIAHALELRLGGSVSGAPRTSNPRAHESYLLGLSFWGRRTQGGLRQAISHFAAAVRQDSLYADAWAGLALAHAIQPGYDAQTDPKESARLTRDAARRALALDSALAHPHAALGWMLSRYEWRWQEGVAELRRAVLMSPNDPVSHVWLATILGQLGRHPEAWEQMDLAFAVDPLSVFVRQQRGLLLAWQLRPQEAAAEFQLVRTLERDNQAALNYITRIFLATGQYDSAKVTLGRMAELSGFAESAEAAAFVDAVQNRQLDRAREQLRAWDAARFFSDYHLAYFFTVAGDREGAVGSLERSLSQHEAQLSNLGVDPDLESLRSEPRVVAILRRINLR